jgi:hypothetical protein
MMDGSNWRLRRSHRDESTMIATDRAARRDKDTKRLAMLASTR